jgi:hypothetical protein
MRIALPQAAAGGEGGGEREREREREDGRVERGGGAEEQQGSPWPGYTGKTEPAAERARRGRGLDSSCTVNNTPPGRDRLAHPRHPATIYLLFVPHTFVP